MSAWTIIQTISLEIEPTFEFLQRCVKIDLQSGGKTSVKREILLVVNMSIVVKREADGWYVLVVAILLFFELVIADQDTTKTLCFRQKFLVVVNGVFEDMDNTRLVKLLKAIRQQNNVEYHKILALRT